MAIQLKLTDTAWKNLSPEEKLDMRLKAWLSPPGINFTSPEAEEAYKSRVRNVIDAIKLKKTPARIPVLPSIGGFAAAYCGYTERDLMYDVDKAIEVANKCTLEFQIDTKVGANVQPGRVWDILDFRLYSWPGHGVDEKGGRQFNESEYMRADEYAALMRDPTDFYWRTYLPRVLGALEPFHTLPYLPLRENASTGAPTLLGAYGRPEIETALQKLVEAGKETLKWQQKMAPANRKLTELGFPDSASSQSSAPFDKLGNTLRGTHGIVSDMFRQPEKLLEALDWVAPQMVELGVSGARLGGCPIVSMPIHRGADGFMSDEQFKRFYWPTLRQVILGLIKEGLVPRVFAEGGYNSRLETIRDLPKGRTIWHFDYTDMTRAKDILGNIACIQGNIPVALIHTGTPGQIEDYCRKLIDTAGKGGGFILSTGAGIDRGGKLENVLTMIKCGKEYGVYR